MPLKLYKPPNSLDLPEQIILKLTSILRTRFFAFSVCEYAEAPFFLRYGKCLDLLIKLIGQPLKASTLLLRKASTLTAIHERLRQVANPLVNIKLI